jgi:fumarylacetoacetate (FAA) hydrolase
MKLASLRDGTRDGRLVVVSRDLSVCMPAVVPTLQQALDRWIEVAPLLQQQSDRVNGSAAAGFAPFNEADCLSPLPRAYQWLDGSAYVNHVELVRKARGAEMPASFWTDPLMYQGGSDAFLAPRDYIPLADVAWGADFEAEVAVITGDVALGASIEAARSSVRLLMLVNDVSLRNLIPNELAKSFGFLQSKPSSAFSPVAVTPDELGSAWDGGRVHHALLTTFNGAPFGKPDAGTDMTFDFATLIAHAAKTRPLSAGTIVGSGTVSNRDVDGGPGKPIAEGGVGYSCIAELRTVEMLRCGKSQTLFMQQGDRVRIEMSDTHGTSIFGAIDQLVAATGTPNE